MPAGGQRAGLGLAVADDARCNQVGVVEDRAEGMRQRIAQFPAFVDRAGGFWGDVAGNAARKGKLGEEALHAFLILADIRVDFRVSSLQVGVGHKCRSAVPGTGNVKHVETVVLDHPVQMHVDEILSGRGSPMPEQPRLDVLELKRLLEQRVVKEVNLADGEIVGRTPVSMHLAKLIGRKGIGHDAAPGVTALEAGAPP